MTDDFHKNNHLSIGRFTLERDVAIVVGVIVLVGLAQLVLAFTKAINWDEFLHYSIVYDLPRGRVVWDYQTIYIRLFGWVPATGGNIVDQIIKTRVVMLGFELLAMTMVVRLAARFSDKTGAVLAGLLYIAGGYTFIHGFSFRPDPMVAALLMSALYLLATGRLNISRVLAIGVLVGFAGLANMKAIFYLPCFAGFALLRLADESSDRVKTIAHLAAIPLVAIAVFLLLHQLHKVGIASEGGAGGSLSLRFSAYVGGDEDPRYHYTIAQALLAPLVTVGILLLPFVWRDRSLVEKVVLTSLILPLVTVLFYRNTFPYFFVFIMPPVCTAVAISLAFLAKRFGVLIVILITLGGPAYLWARLPQETLDNQRFLIGQIHELFPQTTGYLAYTGYVSDYPRVIPNLISGVGLKRYNARGLPLIAQAVERGDVGFVLEDTKYTSAALKGETISDTLLPEDFAALGENYLHYQGLLWVYGKEVCAGSGGERVRLHRAGPYTVDGGEALIEGRRVADGETIMLERGDHMVAIASGECLKLWGIPRRPTADLGWPEGAYRDRF